jgi:hypothetical protein
MRRSLCGRAELSSLVRRLAVPTIGIALLACSSGTEPRAVVTLRVTNAACLMGSCQSLHVLAFPHQQPITPGGPWSLDLGVLTSPEACLTFPPSATFRIWEVGSTDTTKITWTPADSVSLGTLGPNDLRFAAGPTTGEFVPASAAGWFIVLPGGTQASPAPRCTP